MVVVFYQTAERGQRQVGRIVLSASGVLTVDTSVSSLADWLFRNVDRADAGAVSQAMRHAPELFDGAYLRAALVADAEADFGAGNPYHEPAGSERGGEFAHKPGGAGQADTTTPAFAKEDMHSLLRYGASRLSPPQFDEFTRALTGERTTAQARAFWLAKAAEWLEWLQEDPTLLDTTGPQPLNAETLRMALEVQP